MAELNEAKHISVYSGSAHPELSQKIADYIGTSLGKVHITHFPDSEIFVQFEENVRRADAFLIQPTCNAPNDNLMELLIMIDALKRASAGRITAVIPYFGYARQDRKAKARDPISAKLCADLITAAGADRVLSMDLHCPQIQGFFDIPVDHLYASTIFLPYVQSMNLKNLVIASPDVGGSKRASSYAKYLDCPLVLCNKTRERANVVATMQIIGDVEGKDVIIVDDMVDTAGTITKAADIMKEAGARSVRAIASHCVMSGPASERVEKSHLEEMLFTDSIPYNNACAKVKQLTVADMFAEAIRRVMNNQSISDQYLI